MNELIIFYDKYITITITKLHETILGYIKYYKMMLIESNYILPNYKILY